MRDSISTPFVDIFMRIDCLHWQSQRRVCISIDDDLFDAFKKFHHRGSDHYARDFFRTRISRGEIKNSEDARMAIYSLMMKPSAYKCFAGALVEQVDIEDA
jgi:hypothetical protein